MNLQKQQMQTSDNMQITMPHAAVKTWFSPEKSSKKHQAVYDRNWGDGGKSAISGAYKIMELSTMVITCSYPQVGWFCK